jgi:quercetin dioxygenase-like cupin family protein
MTSTPTSFATPADALPIPAGGIASRPLLDLAGDTKVVLFALDQGQEISPHRSPFPAQVLLLAGQLQVLVGDVTHTLQPGEEVPLPFGLPHGLVAKTPSHFVLVMKRAVKDAAQLITHQVPESSDVGAPVPCPCADR